MDVQSRISGFAPFNHSFIGINNACSICTIHQYIDCELGINSVNLRRWRLVIDTKHGNVSNQAIIQYNKLCDAYAQRP